MTYLQVLFPAPVNVEKVVELQTVLGDDVFMHHEFAHMGGQVVSFDLPLVKYSTDDRLFQIMAIYEAQWLPVSDPHSCIIEEGGMKKADYRHLAWKKRLDPLGLLTRRRAVEWPHVREMTPEAIEAMHQT